MLFYYIARTAAGQEVSGTIDAVSKLEAADKLFNEQKLNVVSISDSGTPVYPAVTPAQKQEQPTANPGITIGKQDATRIHIGEAQAFTTVASKQKVAIKDVKSAFQAVDDFLIEYTPINIKEKVVFFRLLSVMINAGLPIVKALRTLANQTENKKLKRILEEVTERVEEGSGFSKALSEYRDVFTEAERGVIAAGEASGQLNKALLDLALSTEKSANLAGKIKSAMIYPAIIIAVVIGVVIVVMTLVVPKIADLFSTANVELPFTTRVLIASSNWFVDSTLFVPNWILLPVVCIGLYLGLKSWRATPNGRFLTDSFLLKLPIFGVLFKKIAITTFAHQISTLTAAGISIIRSMEITKNAVNNEVYRRVLADVKEDIERGIPIHESIKSEPELFPSLVVHMIAVGEQTAQLSAVTSKISDFYDQEIDEFVKNLSTIMEPLIIVVVGGLVGIIVTAIMQPIMMISDVASQQ